MINKKPRHNYAALKHILILPIVAILFVMFSFKPESDLLKNGNQEQLFSNASHEKILKFLTVNIIYPKEARNTADSGKVYAVVKMGTGGIIKDINVFTEKNKITVPMLNEVVIVGYKLGSGQKTTNNNKAAKSDHPELKVECLRVANKLGNCEIPEWQNKNMEFAIAFNFKLK